MHVLIIGAGFSGLCAAIKLRQANISFTVFEKAPEVGGTWWYNKYPGCACDIESHLYSFSFAPKADWSRTYPTQPEILDYLRNVAAEYDLYRHIKLNTEIFEARYVEKTGQWSLRTKNGDLFYGQALIAGQGFLHVPNLPQIKGVETFKGQVVHTADWKPEFAVDGRRICVIGNAASAVQIAKTASHVTVFQRTPNWFVPKVDDRYWSIVKFAFAWIPFVRILYRWFLYLRHELYFSAFVPTSWLARQVRPQFEHFIKKEARPELASVLIPSYPPGCKRIILSGDYLRCLTQENVTVVTTPIDEICPDGVKSGGRVYAADGIVYATGFAPGSGGFGKIYGRQADRSLEELWGDEPSAYLGITVPGFPNLFLLLGPNSGLGHNSVVWMIECQANYALQCVQKLVSDRLRSIEVRRELAESWVSKTHASLDKMVWARSQCRSWYQSARGVVFALWPGHTYSYWWATRRPVWSDFQLTASDAQASAPASSS